MKLDKASSYRGIRVCNLSVVGCLWFRFLWCSYPQSCDTTSSQLLLKTAFLGRPAESGATDMSHLCCCHRVNIAPPQPCSRDGHAASMCMCAAHSWMPPLLESHGMGAKSHTKREVTNCRPAFSPWGSITPHSVVAYCTASRSSFR